MRVVFEMGGGNRGEPATGFREAHAPDWVKLAILEYQGTASIRVTYGDKSFTEWRMRAIK